MFGSSKDKTPIRTIDSAAAKQVDTVIAEPLGGAHSDHAAMGATLRQTLIQQLEQLGKYDTKELLARRYERLMSYGVA